MKRTFLVTFLTILLVFTGCAKSDTSEIEMKDNLIVENEEIDVKSGLDFSEFDNLEFYFSSGAGGWRTVMYIESDGSFSGQHSDSDMGSVGEGYPKGTYYLCDFKGQFADPVKVNEYTYSMKIDTISCAKEPDTEEIIDEVLYYYSTPYGLDGAEEVLIYLPGAPISELPEGYLNWVRGCMPESAGKELPFYGLYNETEQNGFSSYEIRNSIDDMMAATEESSLEIGTSLENDPLTQAEMNTKSMELYQIWDDALNILWTELKEQLSEDEFAELLDEQRAWILEKEAAVEEAGKEVEGGSMYPLVTNMKAAELTKERVYVLYELLQ